MPKALSFRRDVAFLDIMPKIGGFQLAQRFREREELKSSVLIAVTGLIERDPRRRS
jgi:CheY-like chemotaxis protein